MWKCAIREFSSSDDVNTRDYRFNSEKRANERKHSQTGPLSYKVDINGTLWRRHVDQIVGTSENQPRNRTHTVTSNVTYDIQYMPFSCTSDTVSEWKGPVASFKEPRRNRPRNRKKPDRLNLWYVICYVLSKKMHPIKWI